MTQWSNTSVVDDAADGSFARRARRWWLAESLLVPLYQAYERRLFAEVLSKAVPQHVAIILDGNRRYARRCNVTDPRAIYAKGADKLDELLDWCAELAVPAITIWVLSTDNLDRTTEEISAILAAVEDKVERLASDPRVHRERIRVRSIGRLDKLPRGTLAALHAAEAATNQYTGMQLTIAIAYGGRQEIVDAVRSVLSEALQRGNSLEDAIELVSVEAVGRHLYSPELPDPDLIIRTSGEIRLSGFLLWQSAHSEFYCADVFGSAFRKIDFLRAVRAYQQRRRRFGQ
jgi:short-chain Z-isoprenyl diphosphate synthase